MNKKIAMLLLLLIILTGKIPVMAAVDEMHYDINSLEELSKLIEYAERSPQNDEGERLYILENTAPQILEEYTKRFFREAATVINNLSSGTQTIDDRYPFEYKRDCKKLTSGGIVKSSVIDQPDQNNMRINQWRGNLITPNAIYVGTIFGNRIYTASFDIYHFLFPDTRLRLVNRYSVSSKGLVMTSLSTAGTMAIFPVNVNVRTVEITDKYATTVGADINGMAEFNVTIGGYNGIGLVTFNSTITSTMELTSLSSSSVGIKESRTVDHLGRVITD